jgi:hypothetical protein
MLDGLKITSAGLPYAIVEGRWPDAATLVGIHDVVMASHVVYDVADIGPFVLAMDSVAGNGVVIELTDRHPWVHLAPYYRALHGLERPDGPSWEGLAEVIVEAVGREPSVEVWKRPSDLWFESNQEILEFFGRRLLIGPDRWPELERLLEPEIFAGPGGLQVGDEDRDLITMWWGHS